MKFQSGHFYILLKYCKNYQTYVMHFELELHMVIMTKKWKYCSNIKNVVIFYKAKNAVNQIICNLLQYSLPVTIWINAPHI